MNGKVTMQNLAMLRSRRGLGEGGVIQKYIDSEVIRHCAPYAPFETGQMQKSATLGTEIGSGKVVYHAPYARFLYYGKVMVSPSTGSAWAKRGERKAVTQTFLRYNGEPQRGAFWFERMKAAFLQDILEGAKKLGR